MNPYRKTPEESVAAARRSEPDDERTVLWIAFIIGLLPAVVALARGVVWGVEPTVGLLMCALAAAGLIARSRNARRAERREKAEPPK